MDEAYLGPISQQTRWSKLLSVAHEVPALLHELNPNVEQAYDSPMLDPNRELPLVVQLCTFEWCRMEDLVDASMDSRWEPKKVPPNVPLATDMVLSYSPPDNQGAPLFSRRCTVVKPHEGKAASDGKQPLVTVRIDGEVDTKEVDRDHLHKHAVLDLGDRVQHHPGYEPGELPLEPGFVDIAKILRRQLELSVESCAFLLHNLHQFKVETVGEEHLKQKESESSPEEWKNWWIDQGIETFFATRSALLRLWKTILCYCDKVAGPIADYLKKHLDEKGNGVQAAKALIAYFGGDTTTGAHFGRNKLLRVRTPINGPVIELLITEHRLVGHCLFQIARRSAAAARAAADSQSGRDTQSRYLYIECKDIKAVLEVAKDVAECLRERKHHDPDDSPHYPRHWYVDEVAGGRSTRDLVMALRANVTCITSVLCLTVWELIHAVIYDTTRIKRTKDHMDTVFKKAESHVKDALQSGRQKVGYEAVMEFFSCVALQYLYSNKGGTEEKQESIRSNLDAECRRFRDNCGAFHYLAHDVLDCIRVKVEYSDTEEMLDSMQNMMLFLIRHYVRPVILNTDSQDDDNETGEPSPHGVKNLRPLLYCWSKIMLYVRQSMPDHVQELFAASMIPQITDRNKKLQYETKALMQEFVHWGMETFRRQDVGTATSVPNLVGPGGAVAMDAGNMAVTSAAVERRYMVACACFDPFCDILAAHCFWRGDEDDPFPNALALFSELHTRGWWVQQSSNGGMRADPGGNIQPLFQIFGRLKDTNLVDGKGLEPEERVFSVAGLRLLQVVLQIADDSRRFGPADSSNKSHLRKEIEQHLNVNNTGRCLEPLFFMLRAETNQEPQLRIEILKTLAALIGDASKSSSFADAVVVETLMTLMSEAKLLDPAGIPREIELNEEKEQKFPILRSFLGVILNLVSNPHYWRIIGDFDLHALKGTPFWGSSPARLLQFVVEKVLVPHYGGRLYYDSGEKWAVGEKAVETVCVITEEVIKMRPANAAARAMFDDLIQVSSRPTGLFGHNGGATKLLKVGAERQPTMLDQLRQVVKLLDGDMLQTSIFARSNHVRGRELEGTVYWTLRFAKLVLLTRRAQGCVQSDHEDIFTPRRVRNILGLVGYPLKAEVVLEAANILAMLESDEAKLALASEDVSQINRWRQDFRDALDPQYDVDDLVENHGTTRAGRHKERVSWVILKYLLQQARQWRQRREVTQPSLVHVMLGWKADEEFTLPCSGLGQTVGASGHVYVGTSASAEFSFFRGTTHAIQEVEDGVLSTLWEIILHNFGPSPPGHHEHYYREAELVIEMLYHFYADFRTHLAIKQFLIESGTHREHEFFADLLEQMRFEQLTLQLGKGGLPQSANQGQQIPVTIPGPHGARVELTVPEDCGHSQNTSHIRVLLDSNREVMDVRLCEGADHLDDPAVSNLYQFSWYLKIMAVELNLAAMEHRPTSCADKLLERSKRPCRADETGENENNCVVVELLDRMELGTMLKKPHPVERELDGTIDISQFMKPGSRGEELYDLREIDRYNYETRKSPNQRRKCSQVVTENNNFRVKVQAVRHLFHSWKDVVEIILLRKWTPKPGSHDQISTNGKIRALLEALLRYLHDWTESVATSPLGQDSAKLLLQAVLRPLTELASLALARLCKSSMLFENRVGGGPHSGMSPTRMMEIMTGAIVICGHDARVRGNLYIGVLHLMWGCGACRDGPWRMVVSGGLASSDGLQAGDGVPSDTQQLALVEIGRVLARQVSNVGLQGKSLLHAIVADACGQSMQGHLVQLSSTLALCVLENVVRNDWAMQRRWQDILEHDRFFEQLLIASPQEVRQAVGAPEGAVLETPLDDPKAQYFYTLESRLNLTCSFSCAPRQRDASGVSNQAVVNLLPRLQESWTFLSRPFLNSLGHRLERLLDADDRGHQLAARRYHQLVVPALRTLVNVLVINPDNQFVLEQAGAFLQNSRKFVMAALRSGRETYEKQQRDPTSVSALQLRSAQEKLVHITALFHRIFQSSCLARDLKRSAKTVEQLLSIDLIEDYTTEMQDLMLYFYPSSRSGSRNESVLQRYSAPSRVEAQSGGIVADFAAHPENDALKIARNVISVLYLQLRFPIQAPHTIHCRMDHHTHASEVYAEWLAKHSADLDEMEQNPIALGANPLKRQLVIQRNIEKRQLFGMVKMLLAILWHIRVESPKLITDVEESLNVLERLASESRRQAGDEPSVRTTARDKDWEFFVTFKTMWLKPTQRGRVWNIS